LPLGFLIGPCRADRCWRSSPPRSWRRKAWWSMCAPLPKGCGRLSREGRRAVSMIVGRDTTSLDEAAVSRAAIESAAENLSDGVVAPAFWFSAGRAAGHIVLQDRQHRRLHDRPPDRASRRLRLGRRAARRRAELGSGADHGDLHRSDPVSTPAPSASPCATAPNTGRSTQAGRRPRWRGSSASRCRVRAATPGR
jgi:hypothetical protein